MKTRQDNDLIESTTTIYAKNETGLSWPIELGVVCDEN